MVLGFAQRSERALFLRNPVGDFGGGLQVIVADIGLVSLAPVFVELIAQPINPLLDSGDSLSERRHGRALSH